MEHLDAYAPDPSSGLGYADFRAARARFFARLTEQAEVARLERAFSMSSVDPSLGVAVPKGSDKPVSDAAAQTMGEASG